MMKIPTFEEFWKQYPVHKNKMRAKAAWERLSARDKRSALAGLPAYVEACRHTGVSFKYAQGWLNDRRWEDELNETSPATVTPPVETAAPSVHDEMDEW